MDIGKHTYGNPTRRGEANNITVGKFCSIAECVLFDGGFQHNTKNISTYPFSSKFEGCESLLSHIVNKGDIVIGNDVWIGEQAVIMGGVTIGDGAVIGLRSIISKDVKPYSIVAGAPQKIIRYRFDELEIDMLMQMKWWDWDDDQIQEVAHLLMSNNISELYTHYLTNIK